MNGIAYCDGSTRGNPGPYGCAVVLYREDDGVGHQEAVYLGDHGTVNEAEYEGLLLALRIAGALGITHLRIRSDSRLIVEQVLGAWKIKQPTLLPYLERARELASHFDHVAIKHIPREENTVADALITDLMDEATGRKRGERRVLIFA